ncbi:transmembrane protein, putative [Medicago truncatula]|uniref:Transmembrane protein, putative n=1 Tax=Medicago truncatula TaxID=3880 RepID=A0A072UAW6_MEDTR|nr:transmembrane protein, putative [Medicago truncatula]
MPNVQEMFFYINWNEALPGATAVVSTLGGFGSEEQMSKINSEANVVAVNAANEYGSILSNLLLVLETSLLCGDIANLGVEQKYDRESLSAYAKNDLDLAGNCTPANVLTIQLLLNNYCIFTHILIFWKLYFGMYILYNISMITSLRGDNNQLRNNTNMITTSTDALPNKPLIYTAVNSKPSNQAMQESIHNRKKWINDEENSSKVVKGFRKLIFFGRRS